MPTQGVFYGKSLGSSNEKSSKMSEYIKGYGIQLHSMQVVDLSHPNVLSNLAETGV